ncbi:MAG: hypothetical protein ABFD64_10760 [Armatimonadota bacterium]
MQLLSSDFYVTIADMNNLIGSFTDYLQDTLGINVKPQKWDGCRSLPIFMQSIYDCYTVHILSEECLLLVSHTEENVTPAAIQKHYDTVRKKWTGAVIIVRQSIRSNDRRRLIVQYKIPFVVPGNQLYLPDIGLDMREHFRRIREEGKLFSPSTQVLVLYVLLTGSYDPLVSTQVVSKLPYTPMTIKRAFDEIEQANIGTTHMRRKERELRFQTTGRELWDAALPFFRNPVRRRVEAMFPLGAIPSLEAGLTALSRYSMLSAPINLTLAISSEGWRAEKANLCINDMNYDDNMHHLEIWRYDPSLLSTGNTVDRLSLFLSLRDSTDERIEAALNEMMESMQW